MQTSNFNKCDEKIILSAYVHKNRVQLKFPAGTGRTKQSFKAECDINNIVKRFLQTGVFEFTQKHEPRYGDVTGLDFQNAMQLVAGAKSMFNELPAALRSRFDNEPALFLDFVQDPRNQEEARELGLCKPLPPIEADPSTPPAKPVKGMHLPGPQRAAEASPVRGKASVASDAPEQKGATDQFIT